MSQVLIKSMMFYHMDDDQREDLTGQSKPKDLPLSLGANLPTDLQKFFREKYAPAFLCQSVMRYEKYEDNFTDQEKKNMRYWWDGNVSVKRHSKSLMNMWKLTVLSVM